jgi:putative colanic acid biosynthesis UDP-glucose lipid carrier transferase
MSTMNNIFGKMSTTSEIAMRAVDIATLIYSAELASFILFNESVDQLAQINSTLQYFCSILALVVFEKMGVYRSWRGRRPSRMVGDIAISWMLALAVGLLFSSLIHRSDEVSRPWLFCWFIAGAAFVMTVRWVIHTALRHIRQRGRNKKRVVIVGYGTAGKELHRRAMTQNWYGYDVLAIYADGHNLNDAKDESVRPVTQLDELPTFVESNRVDEIWIALPTTTSIQPQQLQYLLRNVLVDIRWIPDTRSIRMLSSDMGEFLGFPTVELNRPVSCGIYGLAKSAFDRLFAFFALMFLLPLFVPIAIRIKRDSSGPIFFKQHRHGLNGKLFSVYKFRTMKLHAEAAGITQAKKDDDRITPFGKFMRRTSIDELPQFLNVLMGDMSIVGPRPHAQQHNHLYKNQIDLYMLRHRVKPGITGWAQIHGLRGETDTLDKMEERVKFDLYYIQNWSFWMDLRIIVWTACKGWTGSSAY